MQTIIKIRIICQLLQEKATTILLYVMSICSLHIKKPNTIKLTFTIGLKVDLFLFWYVFLDAVMLL